MKKHFIKILKSKISQDSFSFDAKYYSQSLSNTTAQDSSRSLKIAKRYTLHCDRLLRNTPLQDGNLVKNDREKFQVRNIANLVPAYLRQFFLRLEPAPPPYTMESVITLQVVMEVNDFASSNF
jgi:hypothetical protein